MMLLAFDPGDRNFGWAFRAEDTTLGYGTLVTDKAGNQWERIEEIRQHVDKLLPTNDFYIKVIIEDGYRRAALIRLIGYLAGYLQAIKAEVHVVKPALWVKEFFGQKKDYKQAAQKWCKKHKFKPATQHEADALCLLAYGGQHDFG